MMGWRRGALLAALGGVFLALIVAQSDLFADGAFAADPYTRLVRFVALWLVEGIVYAVAVGVAMRARGTIPLAVVLAFAALLRLLPLVGQPFLSTDVFRYVWDGRVQAAGLNPYCCIPAAPELEHLRDDTIFPQINRADYAPTIYPPAAQLLFAAVAWIAPTVRAMKLAMTGAEAVAILCMVVLLGRVGVPRARVVIYAWNPLVIWEYAGNAHVDALAIAFIGLALIAGRRQVLAGVALAAAVLTKFLPVVIGPAIWMWRRSSLPRAAGEPVGVRGAPSAASSLTPTRSPAASGDWTWLRLPIAFIVTVLVAYACYASVGWRVLGFLPGYATEEGLSSGRGIFALELIGRFVTLPNWAASAWLALIALVLAGVALRARGPADALRLATILTVGLSPHYAWYFGWIAYLSCLTPWRSTIFLSIAIVASYLATSPTNILWASAIYGCFALVVLYDVTMTRRG